MNGQVSDKKNHFKVITRNYKALSIMIQCYYIKSWYWCIILLNYNASTSHNCYRLFNRMAKV
jgi:hypothetical protein